MVYTHLKIALKPTAKALYPYDVAAGVLMVEELGGKATDGYGKPLDETPLWGFNAHGSWAEDNRIFSKVSIYFL